MIVRAYMTAYAKGAVREIEIPDNEIDRPSSGPWTEAQEERLLERAFYYGQNDFQPKPFPSLSVGDIVQLPDGELMRCLPVGWAPIPAESRGLLGRDAVNEAYEMIRRGRL